MTCKVPMLRCELDLPTICAGLGDDQGERRFAELYKGTGSIVFSGYEHVAGDFSFAVR